MDPSALSNSIAALRSSIKSLESSSKSLESLLYFFVALVVIGVVLEVWFVIWEYRIEFKEFQRGTIRSPQKPSIRKLCFELLGAALVAIGVAGELGVDIKSGAIQTRLRTKNGELIQILEGATSAALVNALSFESQIAAAKAQQKTAEGKIAVAYGEAEKARQLAEADKLEREKLEALIAPRSLSLEQQRKIAAALKQPFLAPRVLLVRIVSVVTYGLDAEAMVLGTQIASVLHSAGIVTIDNRGKRIPLGRFELGIHIRGPETQREFMSNLGNALENIGKLKVFINDPLPDGWKMGSENEPPDTVSILVAVKPPPIIPTK